MLEVVPLTQLLAERICTVSLWPLVWLAYRDSLDSNDEDYFANDYPDEESSGEEGRVWSDGEGDY